MKKPYYYNRQRDLKTRFQLALIIIGVAFIASLLFSCDDEPEVSSTLPFNSLTYSVDVETNASNFDITRYVMHTSFKNDKQSPDAYKYESPGSNGTAEEIPDDATFDLTISEDSIITIKADGILYRDGTVMPSGYTGDPSLWDDTQYHYSIDLIVDVKTKTATTANITFNNSKFSSEVDFAETISVVYQEYNQVPSLLIRSTNEPDSFEEFRFNIIFPLD